jgi:hypothetical protein
MEVQAGTLPPGTYSVQILLESATFKRQLKRRLRVTGTPLKLSYETLMPPPGETGEARLDVHLDFESNLIRPGSLFGYLRLSGPQGADAVLEFNALTNSSASYDIPITRAGTYTATARLKAETVAGEPLLLEPPEETFVFDFDDGLEQSEPEEKDTTISWTLLASVVGGGTTVFAVLIALVLLITRNPADKAAKKTKKPKKSKPDKSKPDKSKPRQSGKATAEDAE